MKIYLQLPHASLCCLSPNWLKCSLSFTIAPTTIQTQTEKKTLIFGNGIFLSHFIFVIFLRRLLVAVENIFRFHCIECRSINATKHSIIYVNLCDWNSDISQVAAFESRKKMQEASHRRVSPMRLITKWYELQRLQLQPTTCSHLVSHVFDTLVIFTMSLELSPLYLDSIEYIYHLSDSVQSAKKKSTQRRNQQQKNNKIIRELPLKSRWI